MADPFLAEIRPFPFTFAPKGWAHCNGQLMPVSQSTALFAILGTIYGGDGKSNFALPDLEGRAPMQAGHGPGLTGRTLGESGGQENVALELTQMPAHSHAAHASGRVADSQNPTGAMLAAGSTIYAGDSQLVSMAPESVQHTGTGQPHNNLQPYLTVSFCIATQGVFPPRS